MAEIPLSIDESKAVDPINRLADQLENILKVNEDVTHSFKNTFTRSEAAIDEATHAINEQTKAQHKNEKATEEIKKEFVETEKAKKKAFDDAPIENATKSIRRQRGLIEQLERDIQATEIRRKRANDPQIIEKLNQKLAEQRIELQKINLSLPKELIPSSAFSKLKASLAGLKGDVGGIGLSALSGNAGGVAGGFTGILSKLGPIGIGVTALGAGLGVVGHEVAQVDEHFDELRGNVELLFKGTEEQTDRIVVGVQAIATTFGIEVKDALTTTNTLAKEFGLSGEEATNVLSKGLNSAANINGNFLEDVKEFAPQIRAAGGDVQDLVNILKISNEEGVFSNKGIDAVKEAGIRLREQSQGVKDSLTNAFGADFAKEIFDGINSGALSSVDAVAAISERMGGLRENSKATQELISGVFGGQGEDAGFRFLTLLKDINDETGEGNEQLTEEQERKQATFEANQRLAKAQNELSKAIGDSSAAGRIWIDIQTFFVELLVDMVGFINDVAEAFESWDKFGEFLVKTFIPSTRLALENLEGLNAVERDQVFVVSQATEAIRKWGVEAKVRIGTLQNEFDALQSSVTSDEEKSAIIDKLNEQYPELVGNIDLERASTEELNSLKEKITQTIIEEEIARKRLAAQRLLDIQIDLREQELLKTVRGSARAKELEAEITFLQTRVQQRIDNTEEETRIQLGLIERKNEEVVESEELTQEQLNEIASGAAKEREKIQDDFNKAIEEILKRGQAAYLNDQIVGEEERLERQRDFQIAELAGLINHARDLQEQLTGSRELDANVTEAYNLAQEAIEIDFQNKILKIQRDAAEKRRAEELKLAQDILKEKQDDHSTQLALIEARQREELALIEQTTKATGRKAAEFERRKQIETLDIQGFYLAKKIELIDEELALKKEALGDELEAIAGKEGIEYDLKRENIDRKAVLLEEETKAQQAESKAQLKNIDDQIAALEKIKGPTLGDVFGDIQTELAKAFDLDPAQLQAVSQAFQQVAGQIFNTIQQSLQEQLKANDEIIAKLNEREEEVKDSLDREIAFAEAGFASNVLGKKDELRQIQEAEEQAAEKRTEILKQQQNLDTISQATSLITASANLYKGLSSLPFGIGIAIATALTGAMIAAFVATKSKAKSVASLETGGYGDETGVISGRRHAQGGERFLDHVEVERGEAWSVFNRRASRKYRNLIRAFTDSVNNDRVPELSVNTEVPDRLVSKVGKIKEREIILQGQAMSDEAKAYLSELPEIRKAMKDKFSEPKIVTYKGKDGATYIREIGKNKTKTTKLK